MSSAYHNPSIIRKHELLRDNHVPETLWYRTNQLKMVAQAIKPLLNGNASKTALIYGPTGSGKTSLSRRFLQTVDEKEDNVKTAYVNCWNYYSEFKAMQALVHALGRKVVRGRVSYEELKIAIEKACNDFPRVVALDELDQLRGHHLLHTLSQLDVALILITNDDRYLFRLDERIKSRLGPLERVHFPPYKLQELQYILEIRAHYALFPNSIRKGQLRRIAAVSEGNAHLAMESLRLAAERAEEDGSDGIDDEHIGQAVDSAPNVIRTKNISRLNAHQRLILQIIKEYGEIAAGHLHREYRERGSEPVCRRTVRNYLDKLEQYGFICAKNDGRWRIYRSNTNS